MIGARIGCREQGGEIRIPSLRPRLPAMCQRVWNPDANRPFADFSARLKSADQILDELIAPIKSPPWRRGGGTTRPPVKAGP